LLTAIGERGVGLLPNMFAYIGAAIPLNAGSAFVDQRAGWLFGELPSAGADDARHC
jgi:hypothetical protein